MTPEESREQIIRDLQSGAHYRAMNPHNQDVDSPESAAFYFRRAQRWKEDLGIDVADDSYVPNMGAAKEQR